MLNKKRSKENFDEMQIQIRNKIGNQCFFMLFALIMLDLYLKDSGVKWAANQMIVYGIIALCMGYYLTRIVWSGAYAGMVNKNSKYVYLMAGLLMVMTTIISIIKKTNFFRDSVNISDGGFTRLFIFFFVFLTIIIVSNIISRRNSDYRN